MAQNLEKCFEQVRLSRIDLADLEDPRRSPVDKGDEIAQGNSRLSPVFSKDLGDIRHDGISVLVKSCDEAVTDFWVAQGVEPELQAERGPTRVLTTYEATPGLCNVYVVRTRRSPNLLEKVLETGQLDLDVSIQHGKEEVLLVLEVRVDRSSGKSSGLRNLLKRGCMKPAPSKHLPCGGDQCLPSELPAPLGRPLLDLGVARHTFWTIIIHYCTLHTVSYFTYAVGCG